MELAYCINPLTARAFTLFEHSLLENRVLHKETWVAKLLGTHLSIKVLKKVKFSWRDNSPLALKGLRKYVNHRESQFSLTEQKTYNNIKELKQFMMTNQYMKTSSYQ